MIQFDEHIFQMAWFNHQVANVETSKTLQEIHLIAHSMGCELVTCALDALEALKQELPAGEALISTISFCSSTQTDFWWLVDVGNDPGYSYILK